MNYNYRAITLNKNIESLFAGIITAEAILDLVYHNFTNGVLDQDPDDIISFTISNTNNSK